MATWGTGTKLRGRTGAQAGPWAVYIAERWHRARTGRAVGVVGWRGLCVEGYRGDGEMTGPRHHPPTQHADPRGAPQAQPREGRNPL
jgi:hypothetical protein